MVHFKKSVIFGVKNVIDKEAKNKYTKNQDRSSVTRDSLIAQTTNARENEHREKGVV